MLYQDLDNLQDLLLQVVDLADEISANISDGLYNEDSLISINDKKLMSMYRVYLKK